MTKPLREFEPISLPPLPDRPLFSVLIPNHNYAQYVGIAIESVLSQTYGNFEAIVCDDGSTDHSREVVQKYVNRDPRVRLVAQENRGVTSAVNSAYENSRGELIALLDGDDAFKPSKLERVLEVFRENPRSGLCVNPTLPVSGTGEPTGELPWPAIADHGWLGPTKLKQGGKSDFPAASGLSLRRGVAGELFPIPLAVKRAPDYYLSHTAQFFTEVSVASQALTDRRIHGANMSGLSLSSRGSGAMHTDAATYEKWVGNTEQILPLQKAFLARFYGPRIAETLRLEDHQAYWYFLLAIRALRGGRAGAIRSYTVQEMIGHVPRRAERRLWRALMLLPHPIAKRVYCFWRTPSGLKGMAKAVVLPWIGR